jgi:hypothetical protein
LALYAVAAGLGELGRPAVVLGADLPVAALKSALRRSGPAALLVWSQCVTSADVSILAGLPALRPPTTVVVGGLGWQGAGLPAHVRRATCLRQALDALAAAVPALSSAPAGPMVVSRPVVSRPAAFGRAAGGHDLRQ